MKKIFTKAFSIVTALILILGIASPAFAINSFDFFAMQRNVTNDGNMITLLPVPASSADGMIAIDGSTSLAAMMTFGSRLSFNHTTKNLDIDLTAQPESNISSLVSDLSAKANTSSLATVATSGSYLDLTNKPTIPTPTSSTYQAFLTQSGTSAPSASQFVNDFTGTTFTWARTGTGTYTVTASNPVFTSNKTAVLMSNPANFLNNFKYTVTSSTVITLQTATLSVISLILTPGNADSLLSNTMFYVVVYP